MEINSVNPRDFMVIQGYGDKGFRVSGDRHDGSILVLPHAVRPWPVLDVATFDPAGLGPLPADTEVLLIGTGIRAQALSGALLRRWRQEIGVAVEIMDTGAACRTFNVLMAEYRPVAAALLAI